MKIFEKIKAMSMEELAKELVNDFGDCCGVCPSFVDERCNGETTCAEGVKKWLELEVE